MTQIKKIVSKIEILRQELIMEMENYIKNGDSIIPNSIKNNIYYPHDSEEYKNKESFTTKGIFYNDEIQGVVLEFQDEGIITLSEVNTDILIHFANLIK